MARLTRRHLLAAAVTASGIALVPAAARAESGGDGYRLLIEDGIDAVTVRASLEARLGSPRLVGRIARDVLSRPTELKAIVKEICKERTVVAGSPAIAGALETLAGRRIPRTRLLPACSLELLDFA